MLNFNNIELEFAFETIRKATLLVKQVQAEMVTPAMTKDDRSPVTIGDLAAQALVGKMISLSFPGIPLVAEEDSSALRKPEGKETLDQVTHFVKHFVAEADPAAVCDWIDYGQSTPGDRFWTLDPIDGTKGYLRGDQYAVALALVVNGRVQVGVLGCPNLSDGCRPEINGLGSLVVAAREYGTWRTSLTAPGAFERMLVSDRHDPTQMRILRSYEGDHTNVTQTDQLAQKLNVQAEPVLMDSQAKYAVLASGEGDLIIRLLSPAKPNYREMIWDQAAGSLIVEEAGGRITDLTGKPLDFTTGRNLTNNRGILASNGFLHLPVIKALEEIKA